MLSEDDTILIYDKASNTDEYIHEEAVPLLFAQLTHEADVIFFTSLSGIKMFSMLFDYVKKKSSSMYYWDESKRFLEAKKGNSSFNNAKSLLLLPNYDKDPELIHHVKSGPKQKLSLEQAMLIILMKLRLVVMVKDSAF